MVATDFRIDNFGPCCSLHLVATEQQLLLFIRWRAHSLPNMSYLVFRHFLYGKSCTIHRGGPTIANFRCGYTSPALSASLPLKHMCTLCFVMGKSGLRYWVCVSNKCHLGMKKSGFWPFGLYLVWDAGQVWGPLQGIVYTILFERYVFCRWSWRSVSIWSTGIAGHFAEWQDRSALAELVLVLAVEWHLIVALISPQRSTN